MIQPNGELLPQPDSSKRKGNYTGERLKLLRPEAYRRVVELLAEPREHVSMRTASGSFTIALAKISGIPPQI